MGIEIISQKNSYTHFSVNGVILKAWTIIGGTIAIAFDDFSFSERLGKKKGYIEKGLNQNPEISDFDNGETTLYDFVSRNLPKKVLREKRYQELISLIGSTTIVSKRFHDKDNGCYFKCVLDFSQSNHIPPVTVRSSVYSGRVEDTIKRYADIKWNVLNAVFSTTFDNGIRFEDLTESEFAHLGVTLSNTYHKGHSIFYEEK